MGAGEVARPLPVGARVGALGRPEELRRGQRGGERPEVDADEGLVAPRAVVVEGSRDELLAGARLAAQQHRNVELGHACDGLAHLNDAGAVADQPEAGRQGVGRAGKKMEKQHDAPRQLDDHPGFEPVCAEGGLVFERGAVEGGGRPRSVAVEAQGAVGESGESQRAAAQVAVLEGAPDGGAGIREVRLLTRQECLPAADQLREQHALADALEIGMAEDGQRRQRRQRGARCRLGDLLLARRGKAGGRAAVSDGHGPILCPRYFVIRSGECTFASWLWER